MTLLQEAGLNRMTKIICKKVSYRIAIFANKIVLPELRLYKRQAHPYDPDLLQNSSGLGLFSLQDKKDKEQEHCAKIFHR